MRVLLDWLREFVPLPATAAELTDQLSLAGLAVDRAEAEALELDIGANRPDCLSHYGVAREIAAITGGRLKVLEQVTKEDGHGWPVHIEVPEACGRYCAVLLDAVTVGPSPPLVAARLEALGQRPINNIADLTNYTLWEMGQPTHAFDADRLEGGQIRVRWGRPGERLRTLDGVERALSVEDLVIADAHRPVALAGVMGGEATAIGPGTRRALIESAWFDPLTIRRTVRRHRLHTDASHRFERGADPEAAPLAAGRIAIAAVKAGARWAGALTKVEGRLPAILEITLRPAAIARTLGPSALAAGDWMQILASLGCTRPPAATPELWRPPSWRPDLTREIDLIEEIARIFGYHRFPGRLPAFQGAAAPLPTALLRDRLRRQLTGRGFAEIVSLSFADAATCQPFAPQAQPAALLNPLSAEAASLRTSALPGLLAALDHNLRHGVRAPRLFEIGEVYRTEANGQPGERAALVLGGSDAGLDFPGLKGEVEALLHTFALPAAPWVTAPDPWLARGQAAALGAWVRLGRLAPTLAARWKLPEETWIAELDLAALYALGPRPVRYQPPPRFPASERDFSFVFPDHVPWAAIAKAAAEPPIPWLDSLWPVEIFRGQNIPGGRYSLLLRARFQNPDRTLAAADIEPSARALVARLRALGGEQR
ncbi:MAG: phenylalanine--tRNA ligase subunit beta [Terriglobales bacterium]